jgi:hypothetical protein
VRTGFWWGDPREGDHLEDPGIYRAVIIKWIFKKRDGWHGLDSSGSGLGQVAGSCECSYEPSGSIK